MVTTAHRPFIGVPTTTTVAFYYGGSVYLDRLSIIHADGAGVRSRISLPLGTLLPIVFELSSAREPIQAKAEVIGDRPTTPAGLALLQTHGESVFADAMDVGESMTRLVRLDALAAPQKPEAAAHGGMCWRFVGLTPQAKQALAHHIETARRLQAERQSEGAGWRKTTDIARMFDEDSTLSDKAKDW